MIEIKWIGRGGQGAFTACKILGDAVVASKLYGLAFPSFGPERRGAPLKAFTKISKEEIQDRTEISHADYIVVLDETLYEDSLLDKLKEGGLIVVNSDKDYKNSRIISVDALHLALNVLKRPITNTAMLGAFLGVSQIVDLEEVLQSLANHLGPKLVPSNIEVIEQAYKLGKEAKNEKTKA